MLFFKITEEIILYVRIENNTLFSFAIDLQTFNKTRGSEIFSFKNKYINKSQP